MNGNKDYFTAPLLVLAFLLVGFGLYSKATSNYDDKQCGLN